MKATTPFINQWLQPITNGYTHRSLKEHFPGPIGRFTAKENHIGSANRDFSLQTKKPTAL